MTQPHDSQIGWQVLKRNVDDLNFLTANKGYDWWLFRQKLWAEGVKPVIKHREIGWTCIANNVLLDDTTYHQRSNADDLAVFSAVCETLQLELPAA